MNRSAPDISVVVATHNRSNRLRELLASLRAQTLESSRFEVIVVDDASADDTAEVLARAIETEDLALATIHRARAGGPAVARNEGWRAARGVVIAFTDDDCRVGPDWLRSGLMAVQASPGAIVQGRTDPDPAELHLHSPFSHTIEIHTAGPPWETCNIFYPRVLLETLGGFDEKGFPVCGEDTDLAWRAIQSGAGLSYAPEALAYHAVTRIGPRAKLRLAWRWQWAVTLFARHPGLRRAQLHRRVFWAPTHEWLLRFVIALLLPRRSWPLAVWLAWPYVARAARRRSGLLLLPWFVVHDAVEVAGIVRGAIRARVFVV